MTRIQRFRAFTPLLLSALVFAAPAAAQESMRLLSPDGRNEVLVEVRSGALTYAVSRNGTPVITSMPFTSGNAAGGVLFALTGQHLAGCTVTFNGVPMNITNQNATSIVGTTPPGTPGPATVVVRNVLGCQTQRIYTYL